MYNLQIALLKSKTLQRNKNKKHILTFLFFGNAGGEAAASDTHAQIFLSATVSQIL